MSRMSTSLQDLQRADVDEAPYADVAPPAPAPREEPVPSRPFRLRVAAAPAPRAQPPSESEVRAAGRTVLLLLLVLSLHCAIRYSMRCALMAGSISQQQLTVLTLAYPAVIVVMLWAMTNLWS